MKFGSSNMLLWNVNSPVPTKSLKFDILVSKKTIQTTYFYLQLLPLVSIKKFLYDTLAFSSHYMIWQI